MKSIMITVAAFLVGAQAFGGEPVQTRIRTFRGVQEGYVRLRDGAVVEEYVPAWRPNAAMQAERYQFATEALKPQGNPTGYGQAQPNASGPGFNTIPGTWIQDGRWIQDGPVMVGPLNW